MADFSRTQPDTKKRSEVASDTKTEVVKKSWADILPADVLLRADFESPGAITPEEFEALIKGGPKHHLPDLSRK